MVRFFADTSDIGEIRKLLAMGAIAGVTTNPKIIATDGGEPDLQKRIGQIASLAKGRGDFPISVEVTTNDLEEMLSQAREYAKWDKNVVVKVPMSTTGLEAATALGKEGIRTNVTAIMGMAQAVLAAKAGATFVSFFYGRMGDLGEDPMVQIRNFKWVRDAEGSKSPEIIIGSIRSVADVYNSIMTGAEIVTIPPKYFPKMASHPQTDATINEFLEAWKGFGKNK